MRTRLWACLVAGALLVSGGEVAARERAGPTHFGLGVGAVAVSLLYGPAKVVYAVGGSVVGGLAWLFTGGRNDVARAIIQPAIRGDYVVVPEHLVFDRPLIFAGRDPELDAYKY